MNIFIPIDPSVIILSVDEIKDIAYQYNIDISTIEDALLPVYMLVNFKDKLDFYNRAKMLKAEYAKFIQELKEQKQDELASSLEIEMNELPSPLKRPRHILPKRQLQHITKDKEILLVPMQIEDIQNPSIKKRKTETNVKRCPPSLTHTHYIFDPIELERIKRDKINSIIEPLFKIVNQEITTKLISIRKRVINIYLYLNAVPDIHAIRKVDQCVDNIEKYIKSDKEDDTAFKINYEDMINCFRDLRQYLIEQTCPYIEPYGKEMIEESKRHCLDIITILNDANFETKLPYMIKWYKGKRFK